MPDTAASLDPAGELLDIARAVQRLLPSWQRPEQFFEARSDISARLRRLARSPNEQPWPPPLERPAPLPARRVVTVVRVVVLPRHLLTPPRRHRYPKPPAKEARQIELPW